MPLTEFAVLLQEFLAVVRCANCVHITTLYHTTCTVQCVHIEYLCFVCVLPMVGFNSEYRPALISNSTRNQLSRNSEWKCNVSGNRVCLTPSYRRETMFRTLNCQIAEILTDFLVCSVIYPCLLQVPEYGPVHELIWDSLRAAMWLNRSIVLQCNFQSNHWWTVYVWIDLSDHFPPQIWANFPRRQWITCCILMWMLWSDVRLGYINVTVMMLQIS